MTAARDPFVLDTQQLLHRVAADDALLDLIGTGHACPGALAGLLTAWRRDIDREPLRALLTAACRGHHPAGALLAATERNPR